MLVLLRSTTASTHNVDLILPPRFLKRGMSSARLECDNCGKQKMQTARHRKIWREDTLLFRDLFSVSIDYHICDRSFGAKIGIRAPIKLQLWDCPWILNRHHRGRSDIFSRACRHLKAIPCMRFVWRSKPWAPH